MTGKFLVWLDILGFDNLAEEMAKESGLSSKKVRNDFINTINERVDLVCSRKEVTGKNYGKRDDWILVVDDLDLAFKVIAEILDHNTQYKDHEEIPLEIAIGTGEYDKWANFSDQNLIIEDSTIAFLKTKIIGYYHEWFRKKNPRMQLSSSFIVLTGSAFNELNNFDKGICWRISYKCQTSNGVKKSVVFFVADVKGVKRRGKVFEFLEKIDRPFSKLYDRIDSLYVHPVEYNAIKNALKVNHIVFITGTPEYGKTYTAVRLLWEYFKNGYEPLWLTGGEPQERTNLRKSLEEIETKLLPKQVIYFEDPFGKIRYETRDILEREIGTIIESIRQAKDVYVIVTSREEVFKAFEGEQLSSTEIKRFEKALNIRMPSYDYSKRTKILLKWATYRGCQWVKNPELRDYIMSMLIDPRKLPTPLSIKDFVYSTTDMTDLASLAQKIEDKSKETARSFAKEIENMTRDKILFLFFPFVARFDKDIVESVYARLTKKLGIDGPMGFGHILRWFLTDKLVIEKGMIAFSHPSYREAIENILNSESCIVESCKLILGGILLDLADIDDVAVHIARFLEQVFHIFDQDVRRELLNKLLKRRDTDEGLVSLVLSRFDDIPDDAICGLLLKLVNNDKVAEGVGWIVYRNFAKIPDDVRNELLAKLAGRRQAAEALASTILCHFDDVPSDLQNVVFSLSDEDNTCGDVAWAVYRNFAKIPDDVRNELLAKLAGRNHAIKTVAMTILDNFAKLSDKTSYDLLVGLAEREDANWILAEIITKNFNTLPSRIQELLLRCSDGNDSGIGVIWAIEESFDDLSPELRDEVLIRLAGKCGLHVIRILINCYYKISSNSKDRILHEISRKDVDGQACVEVLVRALKERALPSKLSFPDHLKPRILEIWRSMALSKYSPSRKNALALVPILRPEIQKDIGFYVLHALSWDEDAGIRRTAQHLMKRIRFKTSRTRMRSIRSRAPY